MFDLSLAEMAFIAVVALVVIGPKELPVLLKTLGRWIGRARRLVRGVMQQLELDDLQAEVKTIQNDAGEVFEAYDLSDIEDASREPRHLDRPQGVERSHLVDGDVSTSLDMTVNSKHDQ